jgi:transcriptional regulator with XRE-family HTH domain
MADEAIYKAFGRAVSVRRGKLKLTQAELAGRVGMSRASIANIESGRQNVLLHHAYSLAAALDYPEVADLLPAVPRAAGMDHLDTPMTGDGVTAQDKLQINELISSALATRSASKAGS